MMRPLLLLPALALVLSACSGNVLELDVGQCFDDVPQLTDPEAGEVDDVPIKDCEEEHDNEVYAVVETRLDDDGYPGNQELQDEAVDVCFEEFEDYVDRDYQTSELDYGAFWPSQGSWENGDREIVCFLYRVDLDKIEGSMQGSGI